MGFWGFGGQRVPSRTRSSSFLEVMDMKAGTIWSGRPERRGQPGHPGRSCRWLPDAEHTWNRPPRHRYRSRQGPARPPTKEWRLARGTPRHRSRRPWLQAPRRRRRRAPSNTGQGPTPAGAVPPSGPPPAVPVPSAGRGAPPGSRAVATPPQSPNGAGHDQGASLPPENLDRSPLTVASVGTYSGPAGVTLNLFVRGAQLWLKHVNKTGGVNGHSVQLLVYDDGGDPARHRAQVQEAVEVKHCWPS